MVSVTVSDYESWRHAARGLLSSATPPDEVLWLADSEQAPHPYPAEAVRDIDDVAAARGPRVPRSFSRARGARCVSPQHRQWGALYRVLWRVVHEGRHVLGHDADPDVRAVSDMAAQVRRDEHKMHAFVRFVPVSGRVRPAIVAWYRAGSSDCATGGAVLRRPVRVDALVDPHARRVRPLGRRALLVRRRRCRRRRPERLIDVEDSGASTTQSMFNPARVNPRAMMREMPVARWPTAAGSDVDPGLLVRASARRRDDRATGDTATVTRVRSCPQRTISPRAARAASRMPRLPSARARDAGRVRRGSSEAARIDARRRTAGRRGRPRRAAVRRAGRRRFSIARSQAAGIDRAACLRHQRGEALHVQPRGKRRIHQTPRLSEMHACRPWLEAELRIIRPATVVALGATAARSLLGPQARVMTLRGRVLENLPWAPRVIVTVHPSAVLRAQGEGDRYLEMLVADLELAAGAAPRRDAGHAVGSAS